LIGGPTVVDIKFARLLVFINALVPLALLAWDAINRNLGANPLEFITHTTGTLTLVFLLLSLAVTPLRKSLGLPWMVRLRRMLGLYAFFYGFLHLTAYMWFDKFFNLSAVAEDTLKRPFHRYRHGELHSDGAARNNIYQQHGQAARRQEVEPFAQGGLFRSHRRGASLLDACEGGHARTAWVRSSARNTIRVQGTGLLLS
jgi:hypothetical protein